ALAFVDARGEELVNLIAEQVAVQEGPTAVGLHEQLDGRFLLGLAAKNLGDDAFHFAAVALVEQRRAPGHWRAGAPRRAPGHARPPAATQAATAPEGGGSRRRTSSRLAIASP